MPNTVVCVDIDGNRHEVKTEALRWRPSAYGIIIKDGSLLVSPQFGGYDLPGGGVELGETLQDALLREIKEETGIQAGSPRLLVCEHSFFKLPSGTKGEFVQSLLFYYLCEYAGGELSSDGFTEDEKIYSQAPEWLPLEHLDESRIASSVDWRPFVKEVLSHAYPRN